MLPGSITRKEHGLIQQQKAKAKAAKIGAIKMVVTDLKKEFVVCIESCDVTVSDLGLTPIIGGTLLHRHPMQRHLRRTLPARN